MDKSCEESAWLVVDYAIWDSFTFDPLVHQAADIISSSNISSNPTLESASTSGTNVDDDAVRNLTPSTVNPTTVLPHPIVTSKKRKRKGPLSHVRSTGTTHKKKSSSLNALGNRRISPLESLNIWDSVMGLSPMFNPLERRVLRYLALHCTASEPIETLSQFWINTFHFATVDRLWHVFVSLYHQSLRFLWGCSWKPHMSHQLMNSFSQLLKKSAKTMEEKFVGRILLSLNGILGGHNDILIIRRHPSN